MKGAQPNTGSRLRAAREARGLSLEDIARTTKISMAALRAMERNDFAQLPGGVFRRAYVRAFAADVGLDPDQMARDYCVREEGGAPANATVTRAVTIRPHSLVRRATLALSAAVVGFLIGWMLLSKPAPGGVEDPTPASESAVPRVESPG